MSCVSLQLWANKGKVLSSQRCFPGCAAQWERLQKLPSAGLSRLAPARFYLILKSCDIVTLHPHYIPATSRTKDGWPQCIIFAQHALLPARRCSRLHKVKHTHSLGFGGAVHDGRTCACWRPAGQRCSCRADQINQSLWRPQLMMHVSSPCLEAHEYKSFGNSSANVHQAWTGMFLKHSASWVVLDKLLWNKKILITDYFL